MIEKLRVDKWLWSVRIFKSRSIASDACKSNKVILGDKILRPSYLIQVGDLLYVKKNGFTYEIQVDKLIAKRVSAPLAQECYTDLTSAEELNKYESWFVGKGRSEIREKGAGRPTKRERRTISDFKDDMFEDHDMISPDDQD